MPNSADQSLMAKVKRKLKSNDQNDSNYYNPLRNHSRYEVEFPDGTTDKVEANVIAESMVTQRDANTEFSRGECLKCGRQIIRNACREPDIEKDYEWLAYFDRMARWKHRLAQTIRCEGLLPDAACRVRCGQWYR